MTAPDIRDIRGPISIPYWWMPLAIAAAVVVLLALAALVVRIVRRRAAKAKTPAEIALARIERAREQGRTRTSSELSAEISDAVRAYIEAQFALRAAHRTTEEFLHDLLGAEAGVVSAHRDALEDLLSWCDLAKFARLALTDEHLDAVVGAARAFIESTASPEVAPSRRRRRGAKTDPGLPEVGT